ncbi:MAG: GatB/YqeY domain-containing protein [Bacteroidetes bacterium]|jgi:uncharacterized protein YqeY|nr:GatB/YqeY domain-containing protein [Bacteroidota bacterium]
MSLSDKINEALKDAMKSKNTVALESLRAIKSSLLLAQTESGAKKQLSEEEEIKILQRLVKQRKESAKIYEEQGREDLAQSEMEQVEIIEKFLPEQLTQEEIETIIDEIISETNASSMADMGKVMGMANARIAGRADGKTISQIIKNKLN